MRNNGPDIQIATDESGIVGAPVHVAIIMDGNGRWANARGLPRTAGHKAGVDAVKRTIHSAGKLGIRYLTLFGFSAENWSRPLDEVGALMGMLRVFLRSEIARFHDEGARLRFIGDRAMLDQDIVNMIESAEALTLDNVGITVIIALSYGGRQEITAAMKSIAAEVLAGSLDPDDIDQSVVSRHLWTAGIPDPDLVIRTSGEQRISNFLLWQSAYAEFVFLNTLWPDFSIEDLKLALREYSQRERRFGAVSARSTL